MDLPLLSALFMLFGLTMYVVLDGFDLGVGALLLGQREQRVRDRMVDAIAPAWDGNETWLIAAGVTLLAGCPLAYGILLRRSTSRSSSCCSRSGSGACRSSFVTTVGLRADGETWCSPQARSSPGWLMGSS